MNGGIVILIKSGIKLFIISNALIVEKNFKSTGINAENIAATIAIWQTVLRALLLMRKEEMKNEKLYQTTMHLVKRLLREGMITMEEYRQIDTIFLEKYRPIFGTLLSDISLTF